MQAKMQHDIHFTTHFQTFVGLLCVTFQVYKNKNINIVLLFFPQMSYKAYHIFQNLPNIFFYPCY